MLTVDRVGGALREPVQGGIARAYDLARNSSRHELNDEIASSAVTMPGTFTTCVTTPRSPASCITCARPAASRSSGTPGLADTDAPGAPSRWFVPAMTSRHHAAEISRHGPSWPRCSTLDCVTRGEQPAAAARNPNSAPVPEPSCEYADSQRHEPGFLSPTCWDAKIHTHPTVAAQTEGCDVRPARRVRALEPPHQQLDHHTGATDPGIREPSRVPPAHPVRRTTAMRTLRTPPSGPAHAS